MFADPWTTACAYYGLAVLSAVAPWMNAEVLMLSAVPLAPSRMALAGLVVAVAAGQMTGKATMYWISRASTRTPSSRIQRVFDRWHARFRGRPGAALTVTFCSALVGVPPFYVVSMMAGTLRVAFGRFLAVGAAGRLLHFGVVAFVPELLRHASGS